jgi:hypothetical protein
MRKPLLRALGKSTHAYGMFLKRPSKAQACGLQVLTLGLWDTWSFWDVCVVKKNMKLEGENTTFGWEEKTKPCLYFFSFFFEIVLLSGGLWTVKVNSIWCPSVAFNSCYALFCLLFLLLPYPLTDVLSRRVTKLFHMIHMLLLTRILEMFFF